MSLSGLSGAPSLTNKRNSGYTSINRKFVEADEFDALLEAADEVLPPPSTAVSSSALSSASVSRPNSSLGTTIDKGSVPSVMSSSFGTSLPKYSSNEESTGLPSKSTKKKGKSVSFSEIPSETITIPPPNTSTSSSSSSYTVSMENEKEDDFTNNEYRSSNASTSTGITYEENTFSPPRLTTSGTEYTTTSNNSTANDSDNTDDYDDDTDKFTVSSSLATGKRSTKLNTYNADDLDQNILESLTSTIYQQRSSNKSTFRGHHRSSGTTSSTKDNSNDFSTAYGKRTNNIHGTGTTTKNTKKLTKEEQDAEFQQLFAAVGLDTNEGTTDNVVSATTNDTPNEYTPTLVTNPSSTTKLDPAVRKKKDDGFSIDDILGETEAALTDTKPIKTITSNSRTLSITPILSSVTKEETVSNTPSVSSNVPISTNPLSRYTMNTNNTTTATNYTTDTATYDNDFDGTQSGISYKSTDTDNNNDENSTNTNDVTRLSALSAVDMSKIDAEYGTHEPPDTNMLSMSSVSRTSEKNASSVGDNFDDDDENIDEESSMELPLYGLESPDKTGTNATVNTKQTVGTGSKEKGGKGAAHDSTTRPTIQVTSPGGKFNNNNNNIFGSPSGVSVAESDTSNAYLDTSDHNRSAHESQSGGLLSNDSVSSAQLDDIDFSRMTSRSLAKDENKSTTKKGKGTYVPTFLTTDTETNDNGNTKPRISLSAFGTNVHATAATKEEVAKSEPDITSALGPRKRTTPGVVSSNGSSTATVVTSTSTSTVVPPNIAKVPPPVGATIPSSTTALSSSSSLSSDLVQQLSATLQQFQRIPDQFLQSSSQQLSSLLSTDVTKLSTLLEAIETNALAERTKLDKEHAQLAKEYERLQILQTNLLQQYERSQQQLHTERQSLEEVRRQLENERNLRTETTRTAETILRTAQDEALMIRNSLEVLRTEISSLTKTRDELTEKNNGLRAEFESIAQNRAILTAERSALDKEREQLRAIEGTLRELREEAAYDYEQSKQKRTETEKQKRDTALLLGRIEEEKQRIEQIYKDTMEERKLILQERNALITERKKFEKMQRDTPSYPWTVGDYQGKPGTTSTSESVPRYGSDTWVPKDSVMDIHPTDTFTNVSLSDIDAAITAAYAAVGSTVPMREDEE